MTKLSSSQIKSCLPIKKVSIQSPLAVLYEEHSKLRDGGIILKRAPIEDTYKSPKPIYSDELESVQKFCNSLNHLEMLYPIAH